MRTRRVVYAGCGLSGRSTSLSSALRNINPLSSLQLMDGEHRIVWARRSFELLVSISRERAHVHYENPLDSTLPGTIVEEIERVCSADGIVFVIDSQQLRSEANIDQLSRLLADLRSREAQVPPMIFQANKRDMPDPVPMQWIRSHFSVERCGYVESVATRHEGTLEALDGLLKLIEQDPS